MSLAAQLHDALSVVCPVAGVSVSRGNPPQVHVEYAPQATLQQRQAAQAIIDGWDWSASAEAARQVEAYRRQAREAVTADTPEMRATRAALRVVFASLVETRAKINELIAWANGRANPGQPIQPLGNRTWEQVLAAVRQQIASESDPST